MNRISMIGLGWLGLPLAQQLMQRGFQVKGSTTSDDKCQQLRRQGIDAHWFALTPEMQPSASPLFAADIAVVTIPPQRREGEPQYYLRCLQALANTIALSPIQKLIFTSATSVYPLNNGEVREEDACRIESPFSDTPWLDIEQVFTRASEFESTIIRLAGLIGGDYQPGRYFSGKPLAGADDPVNMIHRDDCIGIISEVIAQNAWQQVFNASACEHPSRRALYSASCKMAGLPLPEFSNQPRPYRLVNCDRLKQQLGYRFKYPNPLDALGV